MDEQGVLILISVPGGTLTYEDHDIVDCLAYDLRPGSSIESNERGDWYFVYITDSNFAEVSPLLASWNAGGDEDQPYLAKRRYGCALNESRATICQTYRTLSEAPLEQKMTWSELNNFYLVDKASE